MGIYSPQSNTEFHGVLNKNVILPPFGWLDDIKYKIILCVTPCTPWCKIHLQGIKIICGNLCNPW